MKNKMILVSLLILLVLLTSCKNDDLDNDLNSETENIVLSKEETIKSKIQVNQVDHTIDYYNNDLIYSPILGSGEKMKITIDRVDILDEDNVNFHITIEDMNSDIKIALGDYGLVLDDAVRYSFTAIDGINIQKIYREKTITKTENSDEKIITNSMPEEDAEDHVYLFITREYEDGGVHRWKIDTYHMLAK